MGTVELVTASAGSGKTHKLATLLEEAVVSGSARPESILATTFTTRAAAELAKRAQERLIAAGRLDLSRRLGAARIGTVNAVASQLVSDFALELGLSPSVRVADEEEARSLRAEALTAVVTESELDALQDLRTRLVAFKWTEAVGAAIDLARANGLEAESFDEARKRSVDGLLALLDPPGCAETLDRALAAALEGFLAEASSEADPTQATMAALTLAREAHHDITHGQLSWARWLALVELAPGARSRELASPVRTAAGRLLAHPKLREDLEGATTLVLSLASRALAAYEAEKQARCVIDFGDQERLALRLLSEPGLGSLVRERLDLDLVLVDEFQDTSPLQLALFGRLADWARRSVWVGDQKQAIYSFRGTDPALVEACIAASSGGAEVLGKSWRSRPGLVRLTSAVFSPAFEAQGIPLERVRLEPALLAEPQGLGPFVERWRLPSQDRADDVVALAAATAKFLADTSVRVRGDGAATRIVGPGDLAILCRTNAACRAVADALVARGIPATADRPGLVGTPEARLVCAGLRLWRDPGDDLALTELGRLLDPDSTGEGWIERLFSLGASSFGSVPAVARLRADRISRTDAGVVEATDAVMNALDARGLARAWGSSDGRLANLEALRRHAVAFEAESSSGPPTVAGFLDRLAALARAGEDWHGEPEGSATVAVATWHATKGLEWPVVVLFDLDSVRTGMPLGVRVEAGANAPSLDDPLRGRRLRYWPDPFLQQQSVGPFHTRLAATPEGQRADAETKREELRLLYVAWTRARDRVVLAVRSDKLGQGSLALLASKGRPLVFEPLLKTVTWAGQKLEVAIREGSLKVAASKAPEPGEGYLASRPRTYPPALERPSDALGRGTLAETIVLGPPIPIQGEPSSEALGTALHGFFAGDRSSRSVVERSEAANAWLERFGVMSAVATEDVLRAADVLWAELARRYPAGRVLAEVPVAARRPSGTALRGWVDLVVETDAGVAVLDHKVFTGPIAACIERARDTFGQLDAYGQVLAAVTGNAVLAHFIHLPLAGVLVELRAEKQALG